MAATDVLDGLLGRRREAPAPAGLSGNLEVPASAVTPDLNDLEIEDVIDVLVERLEWRQHKGGPEVRCREYALAITKLQEARLWLGERRRRIGGAR